jgi:threonine synthase
MSVTDSHLVCAGCGAQVADDEPRPFRCPRADELAGGDHVLRPVLDLEHASWPGGYADAGGAAGAASAEPANPFVRFRTLLHSWRLARRHGLSDEGWVALVQELDEAVARVGERGFRETPLRTCDSLGTALGMAPGALLVKDETGNVADSHKSRHLMGIALFLEVAERVLGAPRAEELAIASCGNAAFAAAVLARATERRLTVFIPTWADGSVVEALHGLGARTVACPRRDDDPPGDPVTHAFRRAVAAGAVPFTCQGTENGLTLEGGQTLGWELAHQLGERGADRLLVQVGGGALGSATVQGLHEAHALGVLTRRPAIHAVQTEGGHPLERAWRRVALDVAEHALASAAGAPPEQAPPAPEASPATWARWLASPAAAPSVDAVLARTATDRGRYMWAWEPAPESLATGILDDETYDWRALVEAMITTGGWPVVASEAHIALAQQLAHEHTGVCVSATGSAGLAGLLALRGEGVPAADERTVVLFTGVR